MTLRLLKTLQLLGAAAVLALGAVMMWRLQSDPLAEGGMLGLIGLCLMGFGLSALAASGAATAPAPIRPESVRKGLDPAYEGVIDHVMSTIKKFLVLHRDYQENLTGLNSGLSQLPSRNEVQDIIVKLMNRNMEMQSKVSELSHELEVSHQQIVSLRSNITEVGKIAMINSLTELGNRQFFDQALRNEIARARSADADLCLAIADLDRFKSVNDRFGHVVGDHLLRLFADLLGQHIRGKGLAARYGGEEFALLFPNASLEAAAAILEKIRRELESKRWVVGAKEDRLGTITASFGLARLAPGETAEMFVARADSKLFEAKTAGRNRVVVETNSEPGASAGARAKVALH